MVRIDIPDDTAWMYGVVAADASAALMSYVQLDEPVNDQPTALLVPGLGPQQRYRVSDATPGMRLSRRDGLTDARIPDVEVSRSPAALAVRPRHAC